MKHGVPEKTPDSGRDLFSRFLQAAAASPEARKLLDGRYPDPDSALRRIATGGFILRRVNITPVKIALKD